MGRATNLEQVLGPRWLAAFFWPLISSPPTSDGLSFPVRIKAQEGVSEVLSSPALVDQPHASSPIWIERFCRLAVPTNLLTKMYRFLAITWLLMFGCVFSTWQRVSNGRVPQQEIF
ncbi:unnamed protein product [Dibothriocephalus latus]|uniref:Uncharacterized protein n=1 Tax=Dibothriocephalus latus TaxID=60516 RepID=A0A3P7LX66_DIBLA|nr:unnamed protein product [Dibothriocephalus latus]